MASISGERHLARPLSLSCSPWDAAIFPRPSPSGAHIQLYETVHPSSRPGPVRTLASLIALDRLRVRPRIGITSPRRDVAFVMGPRVWYLDARQHEVEGALPG